MGCPIPWRPSKYRGDAKFSKKYLFQNSKMGFNVNANDKSKI